MRLTWNFAVRVWRQASTRYSLLSFLYPMLDMGCKSLFSPFCESSSIASALCRKYIPVGVNPAAFYRKCNGLSSRDMHVFTLFLSLKYLLWPLTPTISSRKYTYNPTGLRWERQKLEKNSVCVLSDKFT